MSKLEYFKIIVLQKNIHHCMGFALAAAIFSTELRYFAVVGYVSLLVYLRTTERKTESYEMALPLDPLTKKEAQ